MFSPEGVANALKTTDQRLVSDQRLSLAFGPGGGGVCHTGRVRGPGKFMGLWSPLQAGGRGREALLATKGG